MTNTTFPLDKICDALDLLQQHGVISDNTSEHELGEWLIENDLTCADLNSYSPEVASEEQLLPLVKAILQTYEDDAREMAWSLAFALTDGGRADELDAVLGDFAERLGD